MTTPSIVESASALEAYNSQAKLDELKFIRKSYLSPTSPCFISERREPLWIVVLYILIVLFVVAN